MILNEYFELKTSFTLTWKYFTHILGKWYYSNIITLYIIWHLIFHGQGFFYLS